MKAKLKFIIILILFVAPVFLKAADLSAKTEMPSICVASIISDAGGKRIVAKWYATAEVISRQPHWDGYSSNAPMCESNAVSIAVAKVKNLHPDIHDWRIENIEMKNLSRYSKSSNSNYYSNVWFYTLSIEPKDDNEFVSLIDTGKDYDELQVVFMDGTVIKPDVLTMQSQ